MWGGQTTKPGFVEISVAEEIQRVVPIIRAIKAQLNCLVSIDTYKSAVAEAAILAGADLVNDISGWEADPEMIKILKKYEVATIAMDNQDIKSSEASVISLLQNSFAEKLKKAQAHHYDAQKIIFDPGFGFGKTYAQNLALLANLNALTEKYPILLGTSRKKTLGLITGQDIADQRMLETLASNVFAISKGCKILRVHDVLENKKAALIADAIQAHY